MRIGGRDSRLAAAWFGGVAMLVQVLLPLLVAAEIGMAARHELSVAQAPAAIHDHHPASGAHPHPSSHGCPLCLAIASGQGFVAAAALPVPLPALLVFAVVAAPSTPRLDSFLTLTYQARAPPTSF